MKKIFLFLLLATSSMFAFAQILRVEAVERQNCFLLYDYLIVLSNGNSIAMDDGGQTGLWSNDMHLRIKVTVDIDPKKIKKGTLIEKRGRSFTTVTMKKLPDKIIKYAKIRQVSDEFNASLYGCFGYNSFLSISKGIGRVKGEASGGKRTVVNVVFTDNSSTSIEASEDPIWLEAKANMKVEHYKCGTYNIYKLLFD